MPLGDICSGISFRYDDSIFVALAEPCQGEGGGRGGDQEQVRGEGEDGGQQRHGDLRPGQHQLGRVLRAAGRRIQQLRRALQQLPARARRVRAVARPAGPGVLITIIRVISLHFVGTTIRCKIAFVSLS